MIDARENVFDAEHGVGATTPSARPGPRPQTTEMDGVSRVT